MSPPLIQPVGTFYASDESILPQSKKQRVHAIIRAGPGPHCRTLSPRDEIYVHCSSLAHSLPISNKPRAQIKTIIVVGHVRRLNTIFIKAGTEARCRFHCLVKNTPSFG